MRLSASPQAVVQMVSAYAPAAEQPAACAVALFINSGDDLDLNHPTTASGLKTLERLDLIIKES